MKCLPDIVYQPAHELSFDLYVPDTLTADACVIYAHGGGFKRGSKADPEAVHFAKRLTDAGFAMASIDYRLNGSADDVTVVDAQAVSVAQERSTRVGLTVSDTLYGAAFHVALEDLSSAISFLKTEGRSFGIGSDKVGVLGLSAGGIAALSTVFKPRGAEITSPDAVVTIAATLVQPWRMRGDGQPCLLINSPRDRIVGIENARLGLTRAEAMDAPFQLIETDVKGHMTQVDVVLDQSRADGTAYFDLITSHFDVLRTSR